MGLVYTEITLKNVQDEFMAEKGHISAEQIRKITKNALADTGAWTLTINETTRVELGLKIVSTNTGTLANGETEDYNMAGPVEVVWKNRRVVCDAIVLPNADDILLGAIPLEAMDLMVNPVSQEVAGVHGDRILHKIK
jgi:predicted aspartyl protease